MPDELIGREAEIDGVLKPLVAKTIDGAKRAAVLVGPTGIGKTALLRWTRDHAEASGALCTFVRAPAAAGLPPRFPIGEVLDGLAESCRARGLVPPDSLRRVLDTLKGATTAAEYPAALPQIATALEACARLAPLAIFIDDLQWVPSSGWNLLASAIRSQLCAALVVATLRGEQAESSPTFIPSADLLLESFSVGPLTREGVEQMTSALLGGSPVPSLVERLLQVTNGNPLFLNEAIRTWDAKGCIRRRGGYCAIAPSTDIPQLSSLTETLSASLRLLPGSVLKVLSGMSIVGRPCSLEELISVLSSTPEAVTRALDTLIDIDLVRSSDGVPPRFNIYHSEFESIVRKTLGPIRSAAMHLGALNMLRQQPSSTSAELAFHAVETLIPPPDLGSLLRAAAREAHDAGAWEDSARWYGLLEHITGVQSDQIWARERRAEATTAFDPEQALNLYSSLIDRAGSAGDQVRLLMQRGNTHRNLGRFGEAEADLRSALARAVDGEKLVIRHAMAVLQGVRGEVDSARQVLDELEEPSRGSLVHAKIVGHQGQVAFVTGDLKAAARLWGDAMAESSDPSHRLHMAGNLAWSHVLLGLWPQARSELNEHLATASRSGDFWNENALLCSSARLAAWAGDFALAIDHATTALSRAPQLRNPVCLVAALDASALTLLEAGALRDARNTVTEIEAAACDDMEAREAALTFLVCGEISLLIGDLARANDHCKRAARYVTQSQFLKPAVSRLKAQILLSAGEHDEASELIQIWLEREIQVPLERARLLDLAARLNWKLNRLEEASRLASDALLRYQAIGSIHRYQALSDEMLSHLPRQRGRPRSDRPLGLTQREVEVLGLVVAGLTDPEIAETLVLSTRTINKHVESAKRKMGVSRRAQLVALAEGLGIC